MCYKDKIRNAHKHTHTHTHIYITYANIIANGKHKYNGNMNVSAHIMYVHIIMYIPLVTL